MTKINYITHDNQTYSVDVQNGLTAMEGAVQNDIPGIDADCGGGMACATCHVYVNDEWFDKLPPKEDGEEDMLDMAFEPKKNSRLSCQIIISDELVKDVIEVIKSKAHTGRIGDGKIFISNIDEVIRIRTGESGKNAI